MSDDGSSEPGREGSIRPILVSFGTIVTFDLQGGLEVARIFTESLEYFAMTASLGSTESLIMPPQFMQPRDFTPEQVETCAVGPGTVRLSIGVEAIEDLERDLGQALARIPA